MTATKYALVPVVATDEMIELSTGGWGFRTAECETLGDERRLLRRQWSAMLAAAPKELPEEVLERADSAYEATYASFDFSVTHRDAHRAGIRAALLAVMGG